MDDVFDVKTASDTQAVEQSRAFDKVYKCYAESPCYDADGKDVEIPTIFEGCAYLKDLQMCEHKQKYSWCETVDRTCREQRGGEIGDGWVDCKPEGANPGLPQKKQQEPANPILVFAVFCIVTLAVVYVGLTIYRSHLVSKWRYHKTRLIDNDLAM